MFHAANLRSPLSSLLKIHKFSNYKMMKRITTLLFLGLFTSFWVSCDIFKPDEQPTGATELEITQLYTFPQSPAVMNIANSVQSDLPLKFKFKDNPQDGEAAFIADNKFVKYTPGVALSSGNDEFDIEIYDDSNRLLATGTFQVSVLEPGNVNPNLKVAFYDHYEVQPGSTLRVDLLKNDAIGYLPYTGSASVDMTYIQNAEPTNIHIFSENRQERAILTYTPPDGFTGRVEFIYELCYGWADKCPNGPFRTNCGPYTEVCDYYFTALVSIDVVE